MILTLLVQGTLTGLVALLIVRLFRQSAPSVRIAILSLGLLGFVTPLPFSVSSVSSVVKTNHHREHREHGEFVLLISAGAVIFGARLIVQAFALRRIVSRATIAPIAMQEELIAIAVATGVEAPPLLISGDVSVPFATRNAIVLPRFVAAERRRPILLHELGHIRYHDVFVYRLLAVFRTAFWFHPVAYAIVRCMREAIEERCDDFAVHRGAVPPREYAEALIGIASQLRGSVPQPAMASPEVQTLAARVRRIASGEPPRRSLLALTLALLLITAAAAAAPRFDTSPAAVHRHFHSH